MKGPGEVELSLRFSRLCFYQEDHMNNEIMMQPGDRFLRLKQVLELIPVGKTTIWRWVQEKRFPQPTKLTARTTVWKLSEINEYIRNAEPVRAA
jgi:prophage regulatory protein